MRDPALITLPHSYFVDFSALWKWRAPLEVSRGNYNRGNFYSEVTAVHSGDGKRLCRFLIAATINTFHLARETVRRKQTTQVASQSQHFCLHMVSAAAVTTQLEVLM